MRAGEEAADPGRDQHRHQSANQHGRDEVSPEESLLDLAAAMITLVRQTWMDRFALAKAEARLALSTVFLLVGLAFLMAMILTLFWVLALVGAGYYALQAGVPWGWVLAVAMLAQVLLAFYLRRQFRSAKRWLTFPETRRAFSRSPGTDAGATPPDTPAPPEHGEPPT